MLVDLRNTPAGERAAVLADADICIVGGGIAGLLLADHLSRQSKLQILLLEAGGCNHDVSDKDTLPQPVLAGDIHRGSIVGRTCALGGCSLTWGGQLLPLPESAPWAIPASELAAYTHVVEELFRLDHLPYDAPSFFKERHLVAPPLTSAILGARAVVSKFVPFPLRNLAKTIAQRLQHRNNVRLVVHALAETLILARNGDAVDGVQVSCPGSGSMFVRARRYVLAAGAVESVRLLLSTWAKAGLVPPAALGCGFCDHLTAEVATFEGLARERVVQELRPWIFGGPLGTVHALKWEAGATLRRMTGLQGAIAHTVFEEPEGASTAALRKWLLKRQQGNAQSADSAIHAFTGAARQFVSLALHRRRWISPQARVALRVNVVQQVPTLSQVRLERSTSKRRSQEITVDWQIAPAEVEGLRTFGRHLRGELAKLGFTENTGVRWTPALDATSGAVPTMEDARHAMGGAALGTSPASSVVDPMLAVHGVRGVYVASTAVFPDGAPHLPTLTLMALTLRLGEHLLREN